MLTGNSSYFLQYLFKDTLIWLFSLFSNSPQEKYLKRFMIILDWLQIELKSRKCWKEKNHGHRPEVSSLRIRHAFLVNEREERVIEFQECLPGGLRPCSFKTLHLLRRLLEAQGNLRHKILNISGIWFHDHQYPFPPYPRSLIMPAMIPGSCHWSKRILICHKLHLWQVINRSNKWLFKR